MTDPHVSLNSNGPAALVPSSSMIHPSRLGTSVKETLGGSSGSTGGGAGGTISSRSSTTRRKVSANPGASSALNNNNSGTTSASGGAAVAGAAKPKATAFSVHIDGDTGGIEMRKSCERLHAAPICETNTSRLTRANGKSVNDWCRPFIARRYGVFTFSDQKTTIVAWEQFYEDVMLLQKWCKTQIASPPRDTVCRCLRKVPHVQTLQFRD